MMNDDLRFSQAYTYGLCDPLRLSPGESVVIDQSYNGGFMAGRITSIFVSKLVKPRTMVVTSLAVCVGAAVIIVAFGTYSKFGVYAVTGAIFMHIPGFLMHHAGLLTMGLGNVIRRR